jgi:hypothetical protein
MEEAPSARLETEQATKQRFVIGCDDELHHSPDREPGFPLQYLSSNPLAVLSLL